MGTNVPTAGRPAMTRGRLPLRARVAVAFGLATALALGGFGVFVHVRVASTLEDRYGPYGTIGLYLVVAAVIGVLAALWPAWRAGRMDVLKAIATE